MMSEQCFNESHKQCPDGIKMVLPYGISIGNEPQKGHWVFYCGCECHLQYIKTLQH